MALGEGDRPARRMGMGDLDEFAAPQRVVAEIEAGFERLASDPEALAAYRAESSEIEAAFDAPAPEW
jgi:hypothetical protein